MTPSARTKKLLAELGYASDDAERRITRTIKKDLFGIIDIVAIRPGEIFGVQATSASNHSSHVKKALAEPKLLLWLLAGGRFEVWSWGKKGARGKVKKWRVRKTKFTERDCAVEVSDWAEPREK